MTPSSHGGSAITLCWYVPEYSPLLRHFVLPPVAYRRCGMIGAMTVSLF